MPDFDGREGTPEERARDIMRRFTVSDSGLLQPCDATEMESFIARAISAATQSDRPDRRDHASFVLRIAPEPEHDKPGLKPAIDELVTGPVDGIHIERMDDGLYWMRIWKQVEEDEEDAEIVVFGTRNARSLIIARAEVE